MLKKELSLVLAFVGTILTSLFVHADQSETNEDEVGIAIFPIIFPEKQMEDSESSGVYFVEEKEKSPSVKTLRESEKTSKKEEGFLVVSSKEEPKDILVGLYNQSGAYECKNPWDVSFTANYIYWQWKQDMLQVGTQIEAFSSILQGFSGSNTTLFLNPGYKSGFQAGMSVNFKGMDNWQLYSEYTWYHSSVSQDFTGTSANPIVLVLSSFRKDQTRMSRADFTGTITAKSTLSFQALDFLIQRPFYFGKKLISNFAAGFRTQWITQKHKNTSPVLTNNFEDLDTTDLSIEYKLTSWGLGPKFALDSKWLFGAGFTFLGNIAQSVLYTSYITKINESGTVETVAAYEGSQVGLDNYGILRPVTESFLGLGWGDYVFSDKMHLDLSVGYNFDVYWNYNMLYFTSSQREGNMYLHGASAQLGLDF